MESGSAEGGRRGRSAGVVAADGGLKKGPWSAVEDEILVEYVKRHGEGNWNAVQRNSGLMRCGKSCRLRWANHLRPNLKKGSFSPEEEKLIIELHAKLGNKWARMASQLPGRTDNEIKNYWNTRLKRRQRAGLPLYPQDLQQEAHRPPPERHPYGFNGGRRQPSLSHNSLSEVPLATFLNLPQKHQLNRPMEANSIVYSSDHQYPAGTIPFCDPSSAAVTSFLLFGQHLPTTDLHQPPTNYHLQLDCISAVSAMHLNTTQAPQPQPHIGSTQSSSSSSGFLGPCGGDTVELSGNAFANAIAPVTVLPDNSGLLGDVLKESVALKQKHRAQERSPATRGKELAADWAAESSTGLMKRSEEGVEEEDMKNYMDDELLSLLNSFPTTAPLPDWYPNNHQWTAWNNMPAFSTSHDSTAEVLHFL